MKSYGITDVGKVRKVNQDNYGTRKIGEKTFIAVVCDGMGGAAGGGIASSIAKDVYLTELEKNLKAFLDSDRREGAPTTVIPRMMRQAVSACNDFTFELSKGDPALHGMGTTLVSAVISEGKYYICNVGDSRAYAFSDKEAFQITKDHSVVQEMIDRGKLTDMEARTSEKKNIITRAVGVEDKVLADTFVFNLRNTDYILLCTDGLSNYLSDEDMAKILYQPDELLGFERKVQCLIDLANNRGGKDNVTAYLIAPNK